MLNGGGYPQGLKGDEIPMQARIVSVADTFDAMTTERPYQKAMELDAALARIKTFVGTRYDERVVAALIEACDAGQISAGRVKLRSRPSRGQTSDSVQSTAEPEIEKPLVA
jgi:HD-GYP domain-containing protein (c-di-GMP phosphodiesterase class II)